MAEILTEERMDWFGLRELDDGLVPITVDEWFEIRDSHSALRKERNYWFEVAGDEAFLAETLRAENKRLKEALEVYADSDTWEADDWGIKAVNTREYGNAGTIARNALNKEKE